MNKNLSQLGRQLAAIWQQLGLNQRISVIMATSPSLAGLAAVAFWSSRVRITPCFTANWTKAKPPKSLPRSMKPKFPTKSAGRRLHHGPVGQGLPGADADGRQRYSPAAKAWVSRFSTRPISASPISSSAPITPAPFKGELARTISQLDQVDSARVMIVMPENRLLTDSPAQTHRFRFCPRQRQRPVARLRRQLDPLSRRQQCRGPAGQQCLRRGQHGQRPFRKSGRTIPSPAFPTTSSPPAANVEQYLSKKAEGMLEPGPRPGPGRRARLRRDQLGHHHPQRGKIRPGRPGRPHHHTKRRRHRLGHRHHRRRPWKRRRRWRRRRATNAVAAVPVTSNRTRKKVMSNNFEINKITSSVIEAAGGSSAFPPPSLSPSDLKARAPTAKPSRAPAEEWKSSSASSKAPWASRPPATPPARTKSHWKKCPSTTSPGRDLTQQLDQQQKRQVWLELAQKLIYPAWPWGSFSPSGACSKRPRLRRYALAFPAG